MPSKIPLPHSVFDKVQEVLDLRRAVGATFDHAWEVAVPVALQSMDASRHGEITRALKRRRPVYESMYYEKQATEAETAATRSS